MNRNHSIFFRLPRELRDEVYGHYVWEMHGYLLNPSNGKLRNVNWDFIDLALSLTCKIIAQEMHGLALRTNKVIFRTALSPTPAIDGYCSALLFEAAYKEREYAMQHMLSWSRSLVTLPILSDLIHRYPENTGLLGLADRNDEDRNRRLHRGNLPLMYEKEYLSNHTQLQDLIELIVKHPGFKALTSKEYHPQLRDKFLPDYWPRMEDDERRTQEEYIADIAPPGYDEASQDKILAWKPDPWWMPTSREIEQSTRFLQNWKPETRFDFSGQEYRDRKYFSATAAAIRFLGRLSPSNRSNLRKIVIQEDHPSVVSPASHAQGLIAFCQENPSFRVVRRVDIWRTTLVPSSDRIFRSAKHDLQHIMMWVHEARILRKRGMPADSFELVLHGPSPEASQHIHNVIVNAAILQEAARETARRINKRHAFTYHPVSDDFPQVVKEILRGEIPVRFEAEMAEVWDLEEILRTHQGEWPSEFEDVFPMEDLEEPFEGWDAARNSYVEMVDWTERMDGWDMLMATA